MLEASDNHDRLLTRWEAKHGMKNIAGRYKDDAVVRNDDGPSYTRFSTTTVTR